MDTRIIILLSFMAFNLYTVEKDLKVISKQVEIECDNLGYPKKSALKSLIAAQYFNELNQYKISIKKIAGGHYSERMYIVTAKKNGKKEPLFFLKISKKSKSTENLIKIQEGPIGQKFTEFINSHTNSLAISKKDLPNIIWLALILVYKNKTGAQKTIEVTPSAQGQLIQNILDSENAHDIKKAAYAIGKALATFQQLFMNYHDSQDPRMWQTVCHGDFGIKNILFNPATSKVDFIDNETMEEGSIGRDLKTILTSMVMLRYLTKNNAIRWPLYLQHCLSFLQGYVESYPIDKRAELVVFIEETLDRALDKNLRKRIIHDTTVDRKKFNEKEFKKVMYHYLHQFSKRLL